MKRRLIALVATILVLGGLVLWVRAPETTPPTKRLSIDGYATSEQLKAAGDKGMFAPQETIAHPVDGIVLGEGENAIELVRHGQGKEQAWRVKTPMDVPAVSFRAERIVKLFEKSRASVHSKVVTEEDLSLFDLESERRIRLTLKRGEETWNGVDLFVGRVERAEAQSSTSEGQDTWVMLRGETPLRVYRLSGVDLRSVAEVNLDELRDKRVFDFKAEAISTIEIETIDGETIGLKQAKPVANQEGQPATQGGWTLTRPAGLRADSSVTNVMRQLANLRAKAFVPQDNDTPPDTLKNATQFKITTVAEEVLSLKVSEQAPLAQIKGRKEQIELDPNTASKLRIRLDDLRDRVLLPIEEDDVVDVTFRPTPGTKRTLKRSGQRWELEEKTRRAPADPRDFLKQLFAAKATRFAGPDEREEAQRALGPDSQRVVVRHAKSEVITLTLAPQSADKSGSDGFWARIDGDGLNEVVHLKNHLRARLLPPFDDLRRRRFFDLKKEDIKRLELRSVSGEQTILERTGDEQEFTLIGLGDAEVVKTAMVKTLINTVTSLRAKAFESARSPEEVKLEGTATHQLLITSFDGKTEHLVIAAQPEGDLVFVMARSGPIAGVIASIPNFQALNLTKTRAQLVGP